MFNVWQTLDAIAGNDLQSRAEGYQDVHNWLITFDKFDTFAAGKDVSPLGKRQGSDDNTTRYGANHSCVGNSSSRKKKTSSKREDGTLSKEKRVKKKYFQYKKKQQKPPNEKLPIEYGNIVECSFNLPRISARLEKLMGTNVVRLTDRKYMKELRQRIQDDYNATLQKRIEIREEQEEERQIQMILKGNYSPENCPPGLIIAHSIALAKEMERERNLIMEGKGEKIPEELADHPVFIVNQRTNNIIAKRRAKLKTNRERNAERLLRQGKKWEHERLVYEEMEKQKELEIQERKEKERELEEKFRQEDSIRGMDLLRINDLEWNDCELDLKQFLDFEKDFIKQRFVEQSEQYRNDPADVANIVRARKKFRDTERKIRQELDEQFTPIMQVTATRDFLAQSAAGSVASRKIAEQESAIDQLDKILSATGFNEKKKESNNLYEDIKDQHSDDDFSYPEEVDSYTESEHIQMLQNDIDNDIKKDCLISNSRYNLLHYEDPKVAKLKQTDNVKDLYQLAEEIILGETEILK